MPFWYFDKRELKNTPSARDGIDAETEYRYRREGSRFIIEIGSKMDLGYNTMATGVVYFHRFYMFHSFRNFSRYVTACTCLLLAGKVEETPKKCKDIIKLAKATLSPQKNLVFGSDPKEEVLTIERILLQTIKFDLQVEHPYTYLLTYAKCLKGDKGKMQKMVQMAWTFINDSLCTTLCLQWEPEIIAIALIYLAGKLSKFEVIDWNGRKVTHKHWWELFIEDMSQDLLEDICHQVLDLYSKPLPKSPPESPPLPPRPKTPDVQLQPLAPPPEPPKLPPETVEAPIESIASTSTRQDMYQYHYPSVQYPPAFATSLGPMPGHTQGMPAAHPQQGYAYQGMNYPAVHPNYYNQNPGSSYYPPNT